MAVQRKLRVGMVGGGGPSNFFGGPHRTAILMDNAAELTAGALRRDPRGSIEEAQRLHFTRGYPDYQTMFREEAALPADQRIDYVTVVTPNATHYEVAKAALEAGFPVLCEKPLTFTLEQSKDLVRLADQSGLPFIVAYTYTAFPMVMLAREMVRRGDIGEVRKVEAWYPQGWLATRLEDTGMQQVAWRVDPAVAGQSNCGGDIGTHAYEFARFVAGRTAVQVQARMPRVVEGRVLDDDFSVFARLDNGGIATFTASQITVGAMNDNGFRVIGSKGRIEWSIMDFINLYVYKLEGPLTVYRMGGDPVPPIMQPYLRLPGGHPEGFHEALANLHKTIQLQIRRRNGEEAPEPYPFPGVHDGAAGIAFIEACVKSNGADGAWTDVEQV